MKQIFQERRQVFLGSCLRYLRYVLNDHFVLVLLVLLGFVSLQYQQLLQHFPAQPWAVYLLLLVATSLLFFTGRIATYLEPADQVFLLAQEGVVLAWLKAVSLRSFLIWGGFQLAGQLILLPLYLRLGLPLWGFIGLNLVLLVGKWFVFQQQVTTYLRDGKLDWDKAIAAESRRQQSILQFFSLFTKVKGITSDIKPRPYLNGLLNLVKKSPATTWDYLYVRAFVRSGDFFALTLRLLCLSLVSMLLVERSWLAVGLSLLFHYLLLFQLLTLFRVYDYQYLAGLYPLSSAQKLQGFKRVLRGLLYGLLALELVVGFLVLEEKMSLLALVGFGFLLNQFYLDIKSKKLID